VPDPAAAGERRRAPLHQPGSNADIADVGLLCLLAAAVLYRYQLNDSSPWTYFFVVQLVIGGFVLILLGYGAFVGG